MGQCYEVTAKINPVNEAKFISKSQLFLQNERIDPACLTKAKYNSVDDIMEFLLVAHQRMYERKGDVYTAWFDASYGWEVIIDRWFDAVRETLSKGDYIEVWPDSGHWREEV